MSRLGANPFAAPPLPMFDAPKSTWSPVAQAEREKLMLELAAASPMRGKPWVDQHDVDGLGLFDTVRSPTML